MSLGKFSPFHSITSSKKLGANATLLKPAPTPLKASASGTQRGSLSDAEWCVRCNPSLKFLHSDEVSIEVSSSSPILVLLLLLLLPHPLHPLEIVTGRHRLSVHNRSCNEERSRFTFRKGVLKKGKRERLDLFSIIYLMLFVFLCGFIDNVMQQSTARTKQAASNMCPPATIAGVNLFFKRSN